MNFTKFLMGMYLLMDKAGDDKGGGGGTPDAKDTEIATLKAELEKLKGAPAPKPPPEDPSLADKARLEREAKEKQQADSKTLESALRFNLGSKEWLKNNASLLPENIAGIFEAADKEKYGSEIQKSNAVKVAVITEFFAKQDNLDLLTEHQKQTLADFKSLTKDVREERVQGIYDSVFEPTFESLRKIKKAQALQHGLATPNDTEDAYKQRLVKMSRQHHLREKQNA